MDMPWITSVAQCWMKQFHTSNVWGINADNESSLWSKIIVCSCFNPWHSSPPQKAIHIELSLCLCITLWQISDSYKNNYVSANHCLLRLVDLNSLHFYVASSRLWILASECSMNRIGCCSKLLALGSKVILCKIMQHLAYT